MTDLSSFLGKEIGGWHVKRLLGRGAMGAVFEATSGSRRAALKVILAGTSATEKDRLRFVREAKAVSLIRSENVCGCLGSGEEAGVQWLALEFVQGRDLMEVLKLRGRLSVDEALDYSRQALLGLIDAHAAGVVHRDLKPANAILTAEGRVKLVDFGLARRENESIALTAEGTILGTPYYMSPEQIQGSPVDGRADLYSLGHMIYHFFVGRPAYGGRTSMEVLTAHMRRTIPSVQEARPDAPAGLDRFLRKLANPAVEERYPSAREALAAWDEMAARRDRKQPKDSPAADGYGTHDIDAYGATHAPEAKGQALRAPPPARTPSSAPGTDALDATVADPPHATTVTRAGHSPGAAPPRAPAPSGGRPSGPPPAIPSKSPAASAPPPSDLPEAPLGLVVGALAAAGCWFGAPLVALGTLPQRGGATALGFAIAFELTRRAIRDRNVAARTTHSVKFDNLVKGGSPLLAGNDQFLAVQKATRLEGAGDLAAAASARREAGDRKEAARLFEEAGRLREAANVRAEMGQHLEAADLLCRAGEPLAAARLLSERAAALEARREHERDPRRLARLDEELAPLVERASVLFRDQGQQQEGAKLLARVGRHRDAAELYLEVGAREEASRQFQAAGDHQRAAELYERAGDAIAAARLTVPELLRKGDKAGAARALEEVGDRAQAARYYEEAGELDRAADLHERLGKPLRAAELLERGGKLVRAAELFLQGGDAFGAGRAYEQAEQLDRALECYRGIPEGSKDWGQAMRRIARLEERTSGAAPDRSQAPSGPEATRIETALVSASGAARAASSGLAGSASSPAAADPRRWIGREVDRYRVRDHLGSGAFADVFRAEHVHLERPVALKILRQDVATSAGVSERFLAEAKVVSRIRHPGIVQIHDFGLVDGTPFMALELVEGRTLRALIEKGPQPVATVVSLGKELCAALAAAHAAGVIHRDLKPENVLVDRDGHAHVLDFGMARVFWGTARDDGAGFLGTPRYASPEAAVNGDVAAPADQYALGLILYELATGRMPFESGSAVGWLHHHRETRPAPPRQLRPDLPAPLEAAILRALAKGSHERHADLRALERALGS